MDKKKSKTPVQQEGVKAVDGLRLGIPFCLGSVAFALPAGEARPKETHRWQCYVREAYPGKQPPLHTVIEKVVFRLGAGFGDAKVEVSEPPFVVRRTGWANANIDVDLVLRGESSRGQIKEREEHDSSSELEDTPSGEASLKKTLVDRLRCVTLHHKVLVHERHIPNEKLLLAATAQLGKRPAISIDGIQGRPIVSERRDTLLLVSAPTAIVVMLAPPQAKRGGTKKGKQGPPKASQETSLTSVPMSNASHWDPPHAWLTLDDDVKAAVTERAEEARATSLKVLARVHRELAAEQESLMASLFEAHEGVERATEYAEEALQEAEEALSAKRARE